MSNRSPDSICPECGDNLRLSFGVVNSDQAYRSLLLVKAAGVLVIGVFLAQLCTSLAQTAQDALSFKSWWDRIQTSGPASGEREFFIPDIAAWAAFRIISSVFLLTMLWFGYHLLTSHSPRVRRLVQRLIP